MVDFMIFMANLGWKILGLVFGFMMFVYIVKNGPETFRAIINVISVGIQTLCVVIRKKLVNYLRKEAGVKTDDPDADEDSAEGTA